MSLQKTAGTVSGATFISRIFGLVRDQLFAMLLGAGFYSDAFIIAFRIPNLLRDLFAEGALSNAFVPTFTEYEVKRSPQDAWKLANLTIGFLLAVVGGITLIGILFAPDLVALIAPGFNSVPGKEDLTVLLTRIMFPFLPTIALASVFMGMLNVKDRFGIPAFAPVMFNVVSILFGLALWTAGVPPRQAVIGWSIGTLLGGIAQAGIQIPSLRRLGWRFQPTLQGWKESEGLRQMGRLMLPAVIGLSATQINILVNSILASLLEQGSPSWLNYAFRLMQLPIGIFGVAIGMVTLPKISKDAMNASKDDFRKNVTTSMNLVLLFTVPAAVGLWVLGEPIIRLIYQHGQFHVADTLATSSALAFYAVGLPAYAAVKVLAPAFYALKDARSPMIASMTAVGLNIIFNVSFYKIFGYKGLAFGTSVAAITNLGMLLFWFQTKHAGLLLKPLFFRLGQFILASLIMGGVCYGIYQPMHIEGGGFIVRLAETFVPVGAGTTVYFIVLSMMNVPEIELAKKSIQKLSQRFF